MKIFCRLFGLCGVLRGPSSRRFVPKLLSRSGPGRTLTDRSPLGASRRHCTSFWLCRRMCPRFFVCWGECLRSVRVRRYFGKFFGARTRKNFFERGRNFSRKIALVVPLGEPKAPPGYGRVLRSVGTGVGPARSSGRCGCAPLTWPLTWPFLRLDQYGGGPLWGGDGGGAPSPKCCKIGNSDCRFFGGVPEGPESPNAPTPVRSPVPPAVAAGP